MHEAERHQAIIAALLAKPLLSLAELATLTGASEATVRRDVVRLSAIGKLVRVRGGAQSIAGIHKARLDAPSYAATKDQRLAEKRAIARVAAGLCDDGDAIIINGGTTTFQMVFPLSQANLQVFTNSFPIADHLMQHSRNNVVLPSGSIYREQNIILSPYDEDGSRFFFALRMFVGTRSISAHGLAENDPLLVQAIQRLLGQAKELVVLADSTKFTNSASLHACPLNRVNTLITDAQISDKQATMIEQAGVRLLVADIQSADRTTDVSDQGLSR